MFRLLKRIKIISCNHSYDYWGQEELYASVGNESRDITTPVHTFICRKCNHTIMIWDRRK
jgi:hypothetical protein